MGAGRWVKKTLGLGPFWRGLNTAAALNMVPVDQAQQVINADFQDGTVRGLYGPAAIVPTIAANQAHMHYQRGFATWYAEANPQFHTYDADNFSFYTTANSPQRPLYDNGVVQQKTLGVDAPTMAPTEDTPGTAGYRSFRYTYVTDAAGYTSMESNPSAALVTPTGGPPVGADPGCEIEVTGSGVAAVGHIRIWMTQLAPTEEELTAVHYLVATVSDTTQTYTVTGSEDLEGAEVLDWAAGGDSDEDVYKYDHSPPTGANTFSTGGLHAAIRYAAAPCSGIAMLGVGSLLKWSMAGYPWYWPTWASWEAPAYIEAIVHDQGASYILTNSQIFVATGDWEEAISITPSRSSYGTTWGHSAVMSPYGLLFQAQGGIALFDGTTSRIITDGILSPFELTGKKLAGVFFDNEYILLDYQSGGGFIIDFSRGIDRLSITRHNWAGSAITLANATSGITNGPYINVALTGAIGLWQPRQRGYFGGTLLATTYTSGRLDAGMPGIQKKWRRMRVQASGTWSMTVSAGNFVGAAPSPGSLTFTGSGETFLPISFWCGWITIQWSSADGTGALFSCEVEYEVPV